MQRRYRVDLILAAQHTALELEVLKTVARLRRLGQADDGGGVQRLLVAQPQPVVAGLGLGPVGQVGLMAVTHVKKVAEHRDGGALLAFAQQGGHRHIQELTQQVEQGAFHRGHGMDGHAQVKGLVAAAGAVAVGKPVAHAV